MALFLDSLPLVFFVVAGLFSPGPNVVMLTTSGARFGFRATLPHLLGVPIGSGILAAISAFGLGALLWAAPKLTFAFQLAAAVWILWLAWITALAGRAGRAGDQGHHFTFAQAILFQGINPKVWAVTVAAAAGFGIGLSPQAEALRLFVVFAVINLGVCLFWTSAGHVLSGVLRSDRVWAGFMLGMAIMMAACVILIFI